MAIRLGAFALMVMAVMGFSSGTGAVEFGNPMGGLEKLKDFEARRSSSSDENLAGNADARPIAPGATLTIADLAGPGQIAHIWCTIAATDMWYSRLLVLRMYWDGEEYPSVECPIGDFFAAGHGMDATVNSLPVRVTSNGRGRNCYWPMPFGKKARITVTNEGSGPVNAFYYYVDWQKRKSLPKNSAYFHAMYRQETPRKTGPNYLILDAVGEGHYVGTVQSVRINENGWYGEGDDFFTIDGAKEPQLRGTGTEDYFCDGWGFRKLDGLYYGLAIWEGYLAGSRSTVYRWHIADPIPFKKSLRVEIEHKGSRDNVSGYIERADDFYTVAYWYQKDPHKPFPQMAPPFERVQYDLKAVQQAENWVASARTDAPGNAVAVQAAFGTGAGQLFFSPAEEGKALTVPLDTASAGKYVIVAFATSSFDYGIYQALLDGKPLGGPVDYYSDGVAAREAVLGSTDLSAGKHDLTFKNVGKNKSSKGFFFGLDGVLPRRVK